MATGMFGANVEELMDIARDFELRADIPDSASREVERAIRDVDWIGSDADTYRDTWGEKLPSQLRDLADLVWDKRGFLEKQADEQDDASKAGDVGCLEATGKFLDGLWRGIIIEGLWGDIKDMLGLIGMNFEPEFSWNLDNALQNWGDMLSGIAGLVGLDTNTWTFSWDTFRNSWGSMLGDFFAVDMWATDPGRALGKVLWNIGSMFIPGYNIAKIFKILRRVDVPDAPPTSRADPDTPSNRGDSTPNGDRGDTDSTPNGDRGDQPQSRPEAPGGTPENLPPGYRVDPDTNTVIGPNDRSFDVDHQRNNLDYNDPRLNRDVTDPASRFDPDTIYTTRDGQTFVTNADGLVEYSSVTARGEDLTPGGRNDNLDRHGSTGDYWDHDARDERGHHNPDFMGGTDDNINLTQQSSGANRGAHYPDGSGSHQAGDVHQQLLETRTRDYMTSHPSENVTWERRTVYDGNGHAVGYQVRVSGESGPLDLSGTGNSHRPDAVPDGDGWVTIVD